MVVSHASNSLTQQTTCQGLLTCPLLLLQAGMPGNVDTCMLEVNKMR
jgi:hypothetical protein